MPDINRKSSKRYTLSEKMTIAKIVDNTEGNVLKAQKILAEDGKKIWIGTIRSCFQKYGDKEIMLKRDQSGWLKYSDAQKKSAVRVFEACVFISEKAIPIIRKDLGMTITTKRLRSWYKKYGREVCEDNRFKDVVSSITENLDAKYKDVASSIVSLAFNTKKEIIERIRDLIPVEKDISKLAMAFKIISEANLSGVEDKPSTWITQYNNYLSNEAKENKDDILKFPPKNDE